MALMSEMKGLKGLQERWKALPGKQFAKLCEQLKKEALLIQRESMKLVPVDTGHLRLGAFTSAKQTATSITVAVGYVAEYAIYVHENLDVAHGADFNLKHAREIALGQEHSRGPQQQAKFLEEPFRRLRTGIGIRVREAIKT